MGEVIIATPLRPSLARGTYEFAGGVSIRDLSNSIRWDEAIAKRILPEQDFSELQQTRYWLCVVKDNDQTAGDKEYQAARLASIAMQILCPVGAKHIFLKLEGTPGGWDNIGSFHPRLLHNTRFGRMIYLEPAKLQTFDALYGGISRAFENAIVRLQNPILLLEHGMQIGNPYLGSLMFVMALDMLFMAGEISKFMSRLGGFLGPDSLIFPPLSAVSDLPRQPSTVVRDVLEDLYKLRNIIAHGQEVPKSPYRELSKLSSTSGDYIFSNQLYGDLVLESALFMLTAALHRIFTEGLAKDVETTAAWRTRLMEYASLYAKSGGPKARKSRQSKPANEKSGAKSPDTA